MIFIKSDKEIEYMKVAGKVVADTLDKVGEIIRPGVTTKEIDTFAENFIRKQGALPGFKGLYNFPATLCISVNEQVVHGIPDDRKLLEGDIVSIDCGSLYKGYYGDAARTYPVGKISLDAQKLIDVTKQSFFEGLNYAYIGKRLEDISYAIQKHVESNGFSVVRDYVGHGIGKSMHEDPQVPNYGRPNRGIRLVKNMCLAIEPMVNAGSYRVKTLRNNWTVVTVDGKFSAHYENTVVITEDGPNILTM